MKELRKMLPKGKGKKGEGTKGREGEETKRRRE